MNKRVVAAIVLIAGVISLSMLYWSGYLVFHGPLPSFTLNPGESHPESPKEAERTTQLVIENIRGRGNAISVDVKNIGDQDATSVTWTISVKGGILRRIDLRSMGTLITLPAQSGTTVRTERIPLGFGRLEITVTVEASESGMVTQTARGFKLLFFVIGVRS